MVSALTDPASLAAIALALLAGGMLKGALGLGAPVIAVPVMASFFDVKLAVALMVLPNFTTNVWQLRAFGQARLPGRFPWIFAGAGAVGVGLGTLMLVWLSSDTLKLILSGAVLAYIGLRLLSPAFALSSARANRPCWRKKQSTWSHSWWPPKRARTKGPTGWRRPWARSVGCCKVLPGSRRRSR